MYNQIIQMKKFASFCFKFSLAKKLPLIFTTKNTVLKKYDGLFKDIFDEMYKAEFQGLF